jgi:hypothetical protein
LRSADFFDAEHYPDITFQSTRIEHVEGGMFRVGEAEVSAVDHGASLEADALVGPWVLAGALHDGGR